MKAEEVIGLIPDKVLDNLSLETNADYFVKKLSGKIIFKLFLYGVLNCKVISLRILEAIFNSDKFKSLFQIKTKSIKKFFYPLRGQLFGAIFYFLIANENL